MEPQWARVPGVAFLAAAVLIAQTQQPVFKSAAIHVRVDVIATDKNGQPVTDLTASDFEVIQNGVSQKIADFQYVSIPVIDRKIRHSSARCSQTIRWRSCMPDGPT